MSVTRFYAQINDILFRNFAILKSVTYLLDLHIYSFDKFDYFNTEENYEILI